MARNRSRRDSRSPTDSSRGARCAALRPSRRRVPSIAESPGHPVPAALLRAAALDPLRTTVAINIRGTVTIPAALRRALALEPGGRLIAEATPEGVLLRPAITFPRDRSSVREFRAAIEAGEELEVSLRRRRRRAAG